MALGEGLAAGARGNGAVTEEERRLKEYFLARLEGRWEECEPGFLAEPEEFRGRLEAMWETETGVADFLPGPVMGAPAPEEELAPGTLVDGRYEICEVLGAGAFARVYRAKDLRVAGTETALKLFHSGLLTEALLAPEVRAMAHLRHPGVMRVTDVGELAEGRPYLVREYFAGETLRERMARGPVSRRESREIVRQVASALAAAHTQGLVHCDLKPENILIDGQGRVALIDFGIAELFGDGQRRVLLSSNLYAAPELLRGERPGAAADLYSLGRIWEELGGGREWLGRAMREADWRRRPAGAGEVLRALEQERLRARLAWGAAVAVLAAATGAAGMRWLTPPAPAIAALVPVTAYPGSETQPALCPDGMDVVFAWRRDGEAKSELYKVGIGGGTPVRIGLEGEDASLPAVSRDGKRLAYLRSGADGEQLEICWMGMEGGGRRCVAHGWAATLDWMPDNRRLLVSRKLEGREDRFELGIVVVDSGEWSMVRQDDGRNRIRPSVSPDGTRVVYQLREGDGLGRVAVGELRDGRLRDVGWSGEYQELQKPMWSADGRHILFLAGRQNNRQVHVARWDRLDRARLLPEFGQKLDYLAVASGRNTAVVAQSQEDQNIWRIDLGRAGERAAGMRRIAETTWDDEEPGLAEAAGKALYVSDQSGSEQIWEANRDGSEARRLTGYGDGHLLRVWGLAGRRAAVVGGRWGKQEGFHVLELGGGEIVTEGKGMVAGRAVGVGRDGESVFVTRGGVVWRVGLDGAERGVVQAGDIHRMEESESGIWYTFKFFSPVWRGRVAMGEPVLRRAFAAGKEGVYFVSSARPRVLQYRSFDGRGSRDVAELPGVVGYGMAMQRDEGMLLVTVLERTGVDLLAVRDFRLE